MEGFQQPKQEDNNINRRNFLKILGGAAVATALGIGGKKVYENIKESEKTRQDYESDHTHETEATIIDKQIEENQSRIQQPGGNILYVPFQRYLITINLKGLQKTAELETEVQYKSFDIGENIEVKYLEEDSGEIKIKGLYKK